MRLSEFIEQLREQVDDTVDPEILLLIKSETYEPVLVRSEDGNVYITREK